MQQDFQQLHHEFFSVAAGISATIWGVFIASLTLVSSVVKNSRIITKNSTRAVDAAAILFICFSSFLILSSMFFSLGILLPNFPPRFLVIINFFTSAFAGLIVFYAISIEMYFRKYTKLKIPSAVLALLALFIFDSILILLALRTLDKPVFWVMFPLSLGCMAFFLLGILSISWEIISIPKENA